MQTIIKYDLIFCIDYSRGGIFIKRFKTQRNASIVLGLCFMVSIITLIPDGIKFNLQFILLGIAIIASLTNAFILHKKINKNMGK